jgi:GNAT superfamily N-acetyltransferase
MPLTLADLEMLCFDPGAHNVAAFDCGDADLNEFLTVDSQRYRTECLSHTRIALHNGTMVGYITLLTDSIILKTSEKRHLFDFHRQVFTFPALKIGRLGVNQNTQHSGVGTSLLKYAIGVVARLNGVMNVGCRFITVDAYPTSIEWYRRRGFIFNKEYADPSKTHPSMRYDILKSPQIA